jgi:uncharacterized repeat protein (TIGR04138 family)
MSLRRDLAAVLAGDARYTWHAYLFVFESLEHAKTHKERTRRSGSRERRRLATRETKHVTGRELCEGARALALQQYGLLARLVLGQWGIHATSDLGEIVYNLIAAGHIEKTPTDRRSDFDDVFDFETAFAQREALLLESEL